MTSYKVRQIPLLQTKTPFLYKRPFRRPTNMHKPPNLNYRDRMQRIALRPPQRQLPLSLRLPFITIHDSQRDQLRIPIQPIPPRIWKRLGLKVKPLDLLSRQVPFHQCLHLNQPHPIPLRESRNPVPAPVQPPWMTQMTTTGSRSSPFNSEVRSIETRNSYWKTMRLHSRHQTVNAGYWNIVFASS